MNKVVFKWVYIAFIGFLSLLLILSSAEIISFGPDELGFSLTDAIILVIIIFSLFVFRVINIQKRTNWLFKFILFGLVSLMLVIIIFLLKDVNLM